MARTIRIGGLLLLAWVATAAFARADEPTVLAASKGEANDHWGSNSLGINGAMAMDGDWLAVGAARRNHAGLPSVGALTLFRRNGSEWVEHQELMPSTASIAYFGCSLALQGERLLVGARAFDAGDGIRQGAVFAYERLGPSWVLAQVLTASDGLQHDQFGGSVALHDSTAVIGAPLRSQPGLQYQGAAYVFEHDGQRWTERQRLVPEAAKAKSWLGLSVAVHGDSIVLGAPMLPPEPPTPTDAKASSGS